MKRILKSERGIALFLVLWVMALLTVIAGEFCYAIRTEANITRNFKEETQAYYIAVSGLFWAIGKLVVNEFVPREVKTPDGKEEQRGYPVENQYRYPPDPLWRWSIQGGKRKRKRKD